MNNLQQEILNPKIWDNDILKPEIAGRLNIIKQKFLNGLNENNVPMTIVDTRIVGSNASYNYTDFSDIDLHIIVDLSQVSDEDKPLLKMIYNYYKASFNDKYNIKIKGINVELYIEDVETPASSKGVYSLETNEWLKKPEKVDVEDVDISKTLEYMLNKFEEVKLVNNSKLAQSLLDLLYANRIKSLAIDGEFGIDNLVFKEFRNRGYIQELKDIITNGESKELSLESLVEKLIPTTYKGNMFDITTTGISYYDNFLDDRKRNYMREHKGLDGRIHTMSPQDYMYEQSRAGGHDISVEQEIESIKEELINPECYTSGISGYDYFEKELASGYKIPMPYINGSMQEGRHRAVYAMLKGEKEIPVLIVNKIN